jgi:hypothetical protein
MGCCIEKVLSFLCFCAYGGDVVSDIRYLLYCCLLLILLLHNILFLTKDQKIRGTFPLRLFLCRAVAVTNAFRNIETRLVGEKVSNLGIFGSIERRDDDAMCAFASTFVRFR